MSIVRRNIIRLIEGSTGLLIVILTVALPAVYFALGWKALDAHLRTETEIHARQVSAFIARNPDMWKYETIRLEGFLSYQPGDPHPESRRILDSDGAVVAQWNEPLSWPSMVRSRPLLDSGAVVGTLDATLSLNALVVETAAVAAVGSLLSLALFYLVRVYPMAALRSALDTLSRERGRAKVALDSIGEGVISTDLEDRVLLVNRAAETMTGWSRAEAAGRPIGEVFRRDGESLVDRLGSRRPVEATLSPIFDDRGRSLGKVVVFRDVTERVRADAEILKAHKLESLGVLAGGIAHEIRNPLSAINISISSIVSTCARSEGLEPELREKIRLIVEQMASAAGKVGRVVQRIMDFSRPAPPRMGRTPMNDVVEEAIHLCSSTLRGRGIVVSKDLAPDLPPCRADRQLIEQVLVNLITNACQAMEGTEGAKLLEVASAVREGRVVLRVSDSGPGVSPEIEKKIFDPFFTTRKDGSGIGLSFSHRIVAEHGGTLSVARSRWNGAEFRIELPPAREGVPA
jgi:signal transduction histidine kinase